MKTISRQQLFLIAAVALPIIGAGGARVLPFGKSPASAIAAETAGGEAVTEAADLAFEIPKAFDQETAQKSISQIYRTSRQKQFARTPLSAPPKTEPLNLPQVPVAETLTPDQHIVDALKLVKALEFTSILSGREVLAVISGRPRHIGDTVKKGWTLTSIDPVANSVVLHHELAGDHTILLKQRTGQGDDENRSMIEPAPSPR